MTKKLVCFGDSITARTEGHQEPMLTSKLSLKLKGFTVINSGVSGDNNYNPDLVTVLFGANDAAFHKMIDLHTFNKNDGLHIGESGYEFLFQLIADKVGELT